MKLWYKPNYSDVIFKKSLKNIHQVTKVLKISNQSNKAYINARIKPTISNKHS